MGRTRNLMIAALALACASSAASPAATRRLSFSDRVRAQEAIERIYYRHQLGATKPFESAVTKLVLESKVRRYLDQTAALQTDWRTAVTDAALERELLRMTKDTRMPERLQELFAALGHDAFLIKECLVGPVLVDRLTRNFAGAKASTDATRRPARRRRLDEVPLTAAGAKAQRVLPAPTEPARAAVGCAVDGWDNGSLDDGPEPLREPTSVWTGTEMLVWSGEDEARGWRYDPAIDHWSPMSNVGAPSLQRFGPSVVWTGSEMIVWGGTVDASPYDTLDTGGRYDPLTDSWTPTSTVGAPSARAGHTAVWTGSSMIVWGGSDATQHFDSGALYDPSTDTWAPMTASGSPSARAGHTAVWTGSAMVVFGGFGDVPFSTFNTGGRYDPVSNTWTPTSTAGAPSGNWHTSVWTGTTMVVWSGFEGGRYVPASDAWLPVSLADAPVGRRDHSAVWTGSDMIVWGGSSPSGEYFHAGARYNPVDDRWTPTSIVGAPTARARHTSVWTGQLMIVWGGVTNDDPTFYTNYLSTGGRYDPSTDSWTPTATGSTGAPSPRSGHTAVWTGTQMLVWGGDGMEPAGASPLGNGGRYDPAIDSWTSMSTSNAPSPRVDHTAVWTGDTMIVWGGQYYDLAAQNYIELGTGGRYNPITDTWAPTAIAGMPAARQAHTAIWTGSTMVVWGGLGDDGNGGTVGLSTGGRYDPATNTWTPTSIIGAPSARWDHSAVWTGTRMVIWGGGYEGSAGAEGGRYDPAADTWTPMSSAGAPAPRSDPAAIWTGTRMLIWGGVASPPPFDGGSYDPVANAWQPMTRTGQPAALSGASAVWTGSEMVIWGGNGSNPSRSGGRYDPASDTWRSTTTIRAPSGRYGHTAVWTGSRMLVWGGARSIEKLSTGGSWFMDGAATDDCDGDGYTVAQGDCNDNDPGVHPGATETCNHVDDDCDGIIDDGGNALCDDANPCTTDVCEPEGGCAHPPEPESTDCDNGNVCDGYEHCDGYGSCVSSGPIYCFGDENPCTYDTCDPILGCQYIPVPAGTSCSDDNPCNGTELCDEYATCQPGTPVTAPPEVSGLVAAADKSTYSWAAADSATQYDVVRGRTDALPIGPGAGDEICFSGLPGVSVTDASPPPTGTAYWYLARGRNVCAGAGTYGTRSDGSPRMTTTCP
jgi:N-acetylneuraminic acid mutarotase